jgi:hypothetical protein
LYDDRKRREDALDRRESYTLDMLNILFRQSTLIVMFENMWLADSNSSSNSNIGNRPSSRLATGDRTRLPVPIQVASFRSDHNPSTVVTNQIELELHANSTTTATTVFSTTKSSQSKQLIQTESEVARIKTYRNQYDAWLR